ncbi:MAG: phage terminase large subunit family protein [Akkermansia sp.]|nr:phage terminase large subunit family protein [Akkermansia sp.]
MFLNRLLYKVKPSVWDWAQSTLQLPVKTSPNAPGALSFKGQEYLREPLELLRDDSVTHLSLCFGAQVAKTTFDFVAFAYMRAFEPSPALWALPTKDLARTFVKERFRPFLEANPWLIGGVPRENLGTLNFQFRDSNLAFVGVNSPGELSSRPIAFVVMDEASKYLHLVKTEAAPDQLIDARTNTFLRKKVITTSTPSTEEHPFWQRFLATDQRHYFVVCPHCGGEFELKFGRGALVWDHPENGDKVALDTVRRTTRYICPHCEAELWERDKAGMIAAGRWVPQNTAADSRRRGYHLNALYSRFMPWGDVAAKFVEAARSAEGAYALQDFTNSYMAAPFTVYSVRVREESVESLRCPDYARGELPPHYHYLAVAYDCHQGEQWWCVCAIGAGGEQWVIDWGSLLTIEEIAAHAASLTYQGKSITMGYVDSGYATGAVYDTCARSGGLLWPTKGSEARFGTYSEREILTHPNLVLTIYSDHQAKTALYGERIAHGRGAPFHVPRDADETLMRGLAGQELGKRGGARLPTWKPVAGDHLGDCCKLCALSWQVLAKVFEAPEAPAAPAPAENPTTLAQ